MRRELRIGNLLAACLLASAVCISSCGSGTGGSPSVGAPDGGSGSDGGTGGGSSDGGGGASNDGGGGSGGGGGGAGGGGGGGDGGLAQHAVTVAFLDAASGRVQSMPEGIDCPTTCSGSFAEGSTVVLTATPAAGFTFHGWSGACVGTADCKVTVNADVTVIAAFDAAPPPSQGECAGLLPGAPGPAPHRHQVRVSGRLGGVFRPGVVDGSGTLALRATRFETGITTVDEFVSASGDLLNTAGGLETIGLVRQQTGFVDLQRMDENASPATYRLQRRDGSGKIVSSGEARLFFSDLAEDPLGGVVVLVRLAPIRVESYDEQLRLRWSTPVRRHTAMGGIAVDRAGRALVAFEADSIDKSVDAHWIERDGTAGPIFKLLPIQREFVHLTGINLAERVGSGFFVGISGVWKAQIDSGSTSPGDAPEWLKSRSRTKLHMVHGGRGYAVLPLETESADCSQTVEVMAPSGLRCGAATFSMGGGSCFTYDISVGYDGTVVQKLPTGREEMCPSGEDHCTGTYQWWPGFFR
jgi:hypothetical protein